jgi:acyl-CoA thioester hydrolase
MVKISPPNLSKYPYQQQITTRWSDNDQYGHLNNAVYYQLYDALINAYMIEHCGWHPQNATSQIGLVVSSGTEYFSLIRGFPEPITLGMGIKNLGKSSVEYEIGVFQSDMSTAKAVGRFVHVFVDRKTDKTTPGGMEPSLREGLAKIKLDQSKPYKL